VCGGWLKPVTYVCELKYDGLAVSLHYKDGRLVRALKRGDGMKGEEVTENVRRYVDNVPFVIPDVVLRRSHMSGEFEVRGEVVMSRTEFARVNAEAQHQRRSELYSNPRYVHFFLLHILYGDRLLFAAMLHGICSTPTVTSAIDSQESCRWNDRTQT